MINNSQIITLGGGCFWCLEAVFSRVQGVQNVVSGYMGGTVPGRPTYREVSSGLTGHTEVVQITFQPEIISCSNLLTVFFMAHNPRISYKDGNLGSYGSQYRSVIFYHNTHQQVTAELVLQKAESVFLEPHKLIRTAVVPAKIFYEAESAHQNYYTNNKSATYCKAIIEPKLEELQLQHAEKLK